MFGIFFATSMALRHAVHLDHHPQHFFRKLADSLRSSRRECWIRSESTKCRFLKEYEVKQNEPVDARKVDGESPVGGGPSGGSLLSTPTVWAREGRSIALSVRW